MAAAVGGVTGPVPIPTLVYHITHLDNLDGIVTDGALVAKNELTRRGHSSVNIAHDSIQARRAATQVPCCLGGNLLDYVPLYFAPRSPMLYTISREKW